MPASATGKPACHFALLVSGDGAGAGTGVGAGAGAGAGDDHGDGACARTDLDIQYPLAAQM